ncbi:MAG TPA: DUF5808 domain-containing protein [Kineosporiaceae bacterium]
MTRRHAGGAAGAGTARGGRRRWLRRVYSTVGVGLLSAAVVKELRTPAEVRTWHGDLAGLVPYDLRPPTLERVRERLWAPQNPHLIVPRVFGVGWTLNVGRAVSLVRGGRPAPG